jgi:hypothetical protein
MEIEAVDIETKIPDRLDCQGGGKLAPERLRVERLRRRLAFPRHGYDDRLIGGIDADRSLAGGDLDGPHPPFRIRQQHHRTAGGRTTAAGGHPQQDTKENIQVTLFMHRDDGGRHPDHSPST